MRKSNQIKVQFWVDAWVQTLPQVELLFYLYLLTNRSISVSGYYRLNLQEAARAVHDSTLLVNQLLEKFEYQYRKILYDQETGEVYLRNYTKHNIPVSPSLKIRIFKELALLDSTKIRLFMEAPSPTPCIEERDEKKSNKRKEEERIQDNIYSGADTRKTLMKEDVEGVATPSPTPSSMSQTEIIISYLNQKTGSHFKCNSTYSETFVKARLSQNFTVSDFFQVIDCKVADWKGTNFAKYLRPNTLFHVKFESYLNQSRLPREDQRAQPIPALSVGVSNQTIMEEVFPWNK